MPDNLGRDIAHSITIDEERGDNAGDFQFRAYCTDACGWAGEWQHSEDFTADGVEVALMAAEVEGQDHLDGCAA